MNSNSTDQSELAMSLGASPYRHSFEWRMGKLPGREGLLVVIREPQRLLRGACERRVASAVMQARRMHVARVAVRM